MSTSKASLKAMARESKSKKASAKPKAAAKKTPPPPADFKSAKFVEDSSDEDERDSDAGRKSGKDGPSAKSIDTTPKVNGKIAASESSSSSSEGESESASEDSDESSEDEDSLKEVVQTKGKASVPAKPTTIEPSAKAVTFKAPVPYEPPTGFDLISLDGNIPVSQAFKKSALEGKQIWYFTAPASVPIASIGEMSLKAAQNGKAIVNHKGAEYGFVRDTAEEKTYTKIMVPNSSDDGYKMNLRPIDQVYHLQQIIQDPTTSTSKAAVPAKKPIRQQPKGMKMRFRPIGFGDGATGTIGSSSSSDEDSSTDSASDVDMDGESRLPHRMKKAASLSDSSNSGSDDEMEDAPPRTKLLPSIKPNKTIPGASAKDSGVKRKHGEGEEKKSKHSSYNAKSIDPHRRLKVSKKKQKGSPNTAASLSASTEAFASQLSPKAKAKAPLFDIPIPPPKPLTTSRYSDAKTSSQRLSSSRKSKSERKHHSSPITPLQSTHLSLHSLTRATDPGLTAEERRKSVKKLKKLRHKDMKS